MAVPGWLSRFKAPKWRARIGRLTRPLTLPGWLFLLFEGFDNLQRLDFLSRWLQRRPEAMDFLAQWGWALAALWIIAAAFLWPESRRKELETKRIQNLRTSLVRYSRRLELMCREYERHPQGGDALIQGRRQQLAYAFADLICDAMELVPETERYKYESILYWVRLDLLTDIDLEERSRLHSSIPSDYALKHAILRLRKKRGEKAGDEEPKSPATPQSPKSS